MTSATWANEYGKVLIGAEDQEGIFANRIASVDSSFLHVLPYSLKYGNARKSTGTTTYGGAK